MHQRKRPRVDIGGDSYQSDGVSTDNTENVQPITLAATFDVQDRVSTIGGNRMEETRKRQNSQQTPRSPFQSFGVSPALLAALSGMSITTPTEIQAACIPPILAGECVDFCDSRQLNSMQGRDCIGNAKTGSGKTIAFALPILQKLSLDPCGLYALILTPTRWRWPVGCYPL
jgi:ATP-dependent RNA helicase DDX49/DBP8